MPYGAGTAKFIFSGTLQGGEVFAHGFQGNMQLSETQADFVAQTANVAALFQSSFLTTAVRAFFHTATVWTTCTGYYYAGGKNAALTAVAPIATGAGTTAGSPLPNQLAMVATLLTGIPGRVNRGRSYLPAPNALQISNGQLPTATATTLATQFAAFLTALKAANNGAIIPVVASHTMGTFHEIKSVRVDTKLDTQRRRANKTSVTAASTVNV
jgi:hypothetical protein